MKRKNSYASIASISFILAGGCQLAATSWGAHHVIRLGEWNNSQYPGSGGGTTIRMTLGSGIYVGWCGAAVCIFIGILLFLGCCCKNTDDDNASVYDPTWHHSQQFPPGVIQTNQSVPVVPYGTYPSRMSVNENQLNWNNGHINNDGFSLYNKPSYQTPYRNVNGNDYV